MWLIMCSRVCAQLCARAHCVCLCLPVKMRWFLRWLHHIYIYMYIYLSQIYIYLRQDLSLILELTNSARFTSQQPLMGFLFPPPQLRHSLPCLALYKFAFPELQDNITEGWLFYTKQDYEVQTLIYLSYETSPNWSAKFYFDFFGCNLPNIPLYIIPLIIKLSAFIWKCSLNSH